MGTWAAGSFGNDAAGDWVIALANKPTYKFLRETLQSSIDTPEDSDENASAVAAAEVICIVEGKIPKDYEEVSPNLTAPIAALQQQAMPGDLKSLAIECLTAMLTNSELKELWEDDDEWANEIKRLLSSLQE